MQESKFKVNIKGETSIKRATITSMVFRYTAAFLGLAYSIALARILSPEDFGVVAIAQVFVTFLTLFQDMGLGAAIVQRQDLKKEDISRIFGFSTVVAVILGMVLLLGGIPMAILYKEPRIKGICAILSIATFFSTLNTVPNALLLKSKRFVLIGLRQVVCSLIASAVGIISALLGAGPYAIAVFSVTNSILTFIWNWSSNRIYPQFTCMVESVGKVFNYSAWLFGFNLVTYFSRNTDNMIVGYYFGTANLGNYNKAYQLMKYPQTYFTSIISSVLHPMLAERQDDIDYIWNVYLRVTKALSLLGVFISILIVFSADEIVGILYGSKWVSAAVYLKYLAVSVWSQMVCGTSGPMFQVLNRTREQFVRGLIIAITVVTATFIGVACGSVEAVSKAVGLSYLAPFVLLLPALVRNSFGKSIRKFLIAFLPDACIAVLLSLVLSALPEMSSFGLLASMAIKFTIAFITFIALLVVFAQMKWIMVLLPKRVANSISGLIKRG